MDTNLEEKIKAAVADYEAALKKHDWTYDYSDDHSVWKRGQAEQKRLEALQSRIDPTKEIWNKYAKR